MKYYKPEGYNSVSPYFVVQGANKLAEFVIRTFGAKMLRVIDLPDGGLIHAELQLNDSVIMLGEASEDFPPIHLLTHVFVPDVDATFEKALQHGCIAIESPSIKRGELDKRGIFKDFAGNFWSVSTKL